MIPVKPIEEDLSGEEVSVETSFDRGRTGKGLSDEPKKHPKGSSRKVFNKKEESSHSFKCSSKN
jgi:hypothetical protein